ncbi:hypothetical protein PPIS_b0807 [Pseudoalteromonas piscicida]|uniref:Uncharacterized protein n=1 Tax=Pseudoalteromonas piscicida TaxID=43662 RepID=A0ABN5CJV8_PSEO7|nr:hypothetical protein PPIS_b0807 [Pseudoalteromonas piscicida]
MITHSALYVPAYSPFSINEYFFITASQTLIKRKTIMPSTLKSG